MPTNTRIPASRPAIPIIAVIIYCVGVLIALAAAPKGAAAKGPSSAGGLLQYTDRRRMCALSAWMCYETFVSAGESFGWFSPGVPFRLWCHGQEPQGRPDSRPRPARLARVTWIFCLSKYPEPIDTVIMLIKGNYRQGARPVRGVCGGGWRAPRLCAGVLPARLPPRRHDLPRRRHLQHALLPTTCEGANAGGSGVLLLCVRCAPRPLYRPPPRPTASSSSCSTRACT